MKLSQAQINAITDQVAFLLDDTYKKFNVEANRKSEEAFEAAANKVPEVKEYIARQGKGKSYNPYESTFKQYLTEKFPEDFANVPQLLNIHSTKEAIRRDVVIIAPECKTTDEVLAKITAKYVV